MDSKMNGFSFTNIRPSPTNPHKKPIYINTGKLQRSDSLSSSGSDNKHQNMPGASFNPLDTSPIVNGGPSLAFTEPSTSKKYSEYNYKAEDTAYGKEDKDGAKSDRYVWLCKFITGIVVILVAIVGTVYFILYYTHPKLQDPRTEPQVLLTTTLRPSDVTPHCLRSQEEIHFKDVFTINCMIPVSYQLNKLYINYKPQYGSYKSDEVYNFSLTQMETAHSGWNITVLSNNGDSSPAHVNITREPVKCDSGGEYTFRFMAAINSTHEFEVSKHTELLTIESKVSDVSLQVKQNNASGGFYEVSCSAQSACTPAPITLLGVFIGDNSKSQPIFGSNFTCIINYNDNDGWTVKCTGTIPENVYSSLNSIACRPTTGNQTVDDKKEIEYEICRDCIFKCPDEIGDSYWFDHKICNIFHRCYNGDLYTRPCPPSTYFNTNSCTCDHTNNLPGECDEQNERVKLLDERASCS